VLRVFGPPLGVFGVGQNLVCDSSPTVRLPFSVAPFASATAAETDRPPLGVFGVYHAWPPREDEDALPLMRGSHVGRSYR
jgi:hypothetical protein